MWTLISAMSKEDIAEKIKRVHETDIEQIKGKMSCNCILCYQPQQQSE
jgi:hypothetical protein